jgi:hypothetical protein
MTVNYQLMQTQYPADGKKNPCDLTIGKPRSNINDAFRYFEEFATKFGDYEFEVREVKL